MCLAGVSTASKNEGYFHEGPAQGIQELIEDYHLEGWLVLSLLVLLLMCCCGKLVSCCCSCCFKEHRAKPLLQAYRVRPQPVTCYYLPTLRKNPSAYLPPNALVTAESYGGGGYYPYLPPIV
jgi:hypothetical protein